MQAPEPLLPALRTGHQHVAVGNECLQRNRSPGVLPLLCAPTKPFSQRQLPSWASSPWPFPLLSLNILRNEMGVHLLLLTGSKVHKASYKVNTEPREEQEKSVKSDWSSWATGVTGKWSLPLFPS